MATVYQIIEVVDDQLIEVVDDQLWLLKTLLVSSWMAACPKVLSVHLTSCKTERRCILRDFSTQLLKFKGW